jgi:hypothetical protein
VQRLRALFQGGGAAPRRRGTTWQQPRRHLEQQVRQQGVAFRRWVAARGLDRSASAACLGIAPRTLRGWEQQWQRDGLAVHFRGRPVVRSERGQRTAVLGLLESVGPGVGLAVLRGQFPGLPRAELHDLLRRYRRVWQRRHHEAVHVLHWQQPGSVWAIDYAEPPLPLEEGFTDLLAVRDLASGQQLLWLPVAAATAATTCAALLWLFVLYGAPLVLKMDNGSPFVAAATQELVAQWQVVALYSPPGLPAYNGAIEAGIGALKVRTHYQAARQGHPGEWTCADAEAARRQGNELGRPWGAHGPTPAATWAQRQPVPAAERAAFQATVACLEAAAAHPPAPVVPAAAAAARCAADARPSAAAAPCPAGARPEAAPPAPEAGERPPQAPQAEARPARASGRPVPQESGADGPGSDQDRAALRREAISRALVAHGYLSFTRRRIPLPIKRKKVPKIP